MEGRGLRVQRSVLRNVLLASEDVGPPNSSKCRCSARSDSRISVSSASSVVSLVEEKIKRCWRKCRGLAKVPLICPKAALRNLIWFRVSFKWSLDGRRVSTFAGVFAGIKGSLQLCFWSRLGGRTQSATRTRRSCYRSQSRWQWKVRFHAFAA